MDRKEELEKKLNDSIKMLNASRDFAKLVKVIKSCKSEIQMDSARNMAKLYLNKWRHYASVSSILDEIIKQKEDSL